MLAAIRKHKAVVIAILLAIVIVAPTYYFLMPRNAVSLPVITATNATTAYNWTGYFSNSDPSAGWMYLHSTGSIYYGWIYANSTMDQKGYPESHMNVEFEADYLPTAYTLGFVVNVTGYTYLNPNPDELNISPHNNLPGYSGMFPMVTDHVNATTLVVRSQHALLTLNNGTGLNSSTAYQFDVNWSSTAILYYPMQYNTPYVFELTVTLEGLYVPVTSTFIINFTDVKP